MNHPACSASDIESHTQSGARIALCVFHLIAGVVVALIALGALAVFGAP